MKESSLSRRRRTKLKLVVSFNGAFRRRPPSWKIRYVEGESRIIAMERNTSLQKLKSKIGDLICPNGSFSQFCLKYHVSESFCGDDGEEEGPLLGLLESDDDLWCMVEEYETMKLKGKLRTRVWIFVCYTNDGYNDSAFVDKNVKNNGVVKALGEGLDCDARNDGENLFVLLNKCGNSAEKLGDDCLRKMVLKQLLVKNLGFRGCWEQRDLELACENDVCQYSPKQLCSELGNSLSSESKNLNFDSDPKILDSDRCGENVFDRKRTNSHIMTNESFAKISPVTESTPGPLNAKDENLPMRCKVSNAGLLGQSHLIVGNVNGRSMLSSNHFAAAEESPKVLFNSSSNRRENRLDPSCEFGDVDDLALSNNMNGENIMPRSGDFNMVKWGLAPPTCYNPLISGVHPMESLQNTESRWSGYGDSICNNRFGLTEAGNRRTCPYNIRNLSNVSELGNHQNFRLDGKSCLGKFYSGRRSSSILSKQCPPSMLQSANLRKQLSESHYYEIRGEQEIMDHGHMFNPPYIGEENLLRSPGLRVPQHEMANLDGGHVVDAGNDKSLLPVDANRISLLGARAVDFYVDLLTSSGIEKIDVAGQALDANSLPILGMGGHAPLDPIEEAHSKNRGEVVDLSNSPHHPCNSITILLSSDNKLLDVEGGHETLDIYQGGAEDLKINGSSVVDLSLHNLFLEPSGKVQLPVPFASRDISEAFLKPQSNGLDLVDEGYINLGPKFAKSSDISSNSLSNQNSKYENDDDKRKVIQQNPKSNSSIAQKDENKKSSSCLKIIENTDLEYIKELGQGAYGTVYHGKWKGSDVAIKRIRPSCFTHGAKVEDRLVADFWKEANILVQLHHPNIVALYGVVIDGSVNCLATVTEYMVNGSLKQVLRRKDRTIDRRKRIIIAMDAAFGMEYLHGNNIVHFDLKSHNFLVNMRDPQRPVCKIGDLGLPKVKQRTLVSGGIRGTIPWMAPELLSGRNLVSEKVDVFSFGIVMWELLTGEELYANMRSKEIIAGIMRGNLRPEIPSWCDPAWRSLMERCWSSNPDCRPSFEETVKELRAMATSMNIR